MREIWEHEFISIIPIRRIDRPLKALIFFLLFSMRFTRERITISLLDLKIHFLLFNKSKIYFMKLKKTLSINNF